MSDMLAHSFDDDPQSDGDHPNPWSGDVFVLPTTVGQQGFWYLNQLDPGNPAYNIAVRFRLKGPLQLSLLERAFNEIVRRHESLRTIFEAEDGMPVQVVAPHLSIPVSMVDLRQTPESNRLAQAEYLTSAEGRGRFDLAAGPLFRVKALRLGNEDYILLITVHHIVADGWSIGVITQELAALYDAYSKGHSSPLTPLSLQYGDYAVWEKQRFENNDLRDQLSYWTRQLSNLPVCEIPTDLPRPAIQTSNGRIESILLPKDLTSQLKDLSNRESATLFMLCLAALKVLLQRHTGRDDIIMGSLVAGRSRVELEPLIGLFINSVALRTDLSGNPSFLEVLARVRETVLQALARQEVPFERVVQAIQPKRQHGRHPIFQINFIYQRAFLKPFEFSGITVTPIPSLSPGAIYDLNFGMVEREEGWRASCEYNTSLYNAATVQRLLDQFQALLSGIAADPTRRISEIPLPVTTDREHSKSTLVEFSSRPVQVAMQDQVPEPAFVPPRDELEARLAGLWEQVLGVRPISITSDFFDLGGHSLLAARLLALTERTFGRKMSLATLLKWPTIESFASGLRAEKLRAVSEQVHAIQPKGSKQALFLVTSQPPLYRPLTRLLGPDRPVYGITSPELSALPKQFTVEDIADNLLEALCEAQPHGPYHLGGWCVSGVIAYEMAQKLRARGEEVPLLIFFDTNCPEYIRHFKGIKAWPVRSYFLGQRLLYHLGKMRHLQAGAAIRYFWKHVQSRHRRWLNEYLQMGHAAPDWSPGADLRRFAALQNLAALEYMPKPYGAPVVLFRSRVLQTGRFRDPQLGWGKFIKDWLIVHELPGRHGDMFQEPFVGELAEKLNRHLQDTGSIIADGTLSA